MNTAQLLIVCTTLLLLALVVLALALIPAHRRLGPPRVGHRVGVHTKQPDYQLVFGVLVGDYADRVVLEHAEYVSATGVTALSAPQHIATADISRIEVHELVASGVSRAVRESPMVETP